jgi:hypothetical protein
VPDDSPTPFRNEACPGLHAAWEEGFQAYLSGRAVPDRHREPPSEAADAWLNGYTAARLLRGCPTIGSTADRRPARPE